MSDAIRATIRPSATSSPPAIDRRDLLEGALGVAAIAATVSPLAIAAAQQAQAQADGRFPFKEVAAGVDEKHHVAEGYDADVLIRWGDPVLPGAPAFDPLKQTRGRRRSCSSATTTTISATSRCRARPTRRSTACSWSTTNTPTKS